MKIIFTNRFFYPDHSATSQLLSDLAFDLAAQGRDIHIITSRQLYDDPLAALPSCEVINGVTVHRAWSTRFGRGNLLGRALDYLSFYLGAGWKLACIAEHDSVIVAKTDPPLISLVAAAICKLRGARLVNWLQDLFPEVASGLLLQRGEKTKPLSRILQLAFKPIQKLRDRSLRRAACNVVIGELMHERLLTLIPEAGLIANAGRIQVIHNWADGQAIQSVAPADNPLCREWGIEDKFVVGYSGNLGRAHEIETLLAAMEQLREDTRIVFLFIGGGAQWLRLQDECARRGLCNVLFKPYQPRERLHLSLSVPDVHLVTLQPQMEGLIVPSKFYGIAAAGRPALFIGAQQGEIAILVREAQCGAVVQPGEQDSLADVLLKLASDPELCRTWGNNARKLFDERFERRIALLAWAACLDELADAKACGLNDNAAATLENDPQPQG